MAIDVTKYEIQDEFGNPKTDFALGNLGDKITITCEFGVSEYAIGDVDNPLTLNYTPGMIGANWIYDPRGQFGNFKIGDQLERRVYATGTVIDRGIVILDKLDNYHIRINSNLGQPDDTDANTSSLNVVNPITSLNYIYNLIENSASNDYNSKVDGSLQKLSSVSELTGSVLTSGALVVGKVYKILTYVSGDDFVNVNGLNVTGTLFVATGTTPTTWSNGSSLQEFAIQSTMFFTGAKPYQIGSATLTREGIDVSGVFIQKFKIIHNTFVTPFFLSEQWTDIQNNINPPYFLNGESLKSIFKFEAKFLVNDPNRVFIYETSVDINLDNLGNVGGFDENFNTGITNYSIDSVTYTRSNGDDSDTLELTTNESDIEIVIKNTVDTPFSNNNTKFTLNFIKAPYDPSEYQGNTRTLAQNFCFDRALQTVGAAAVNGDNFGGNYQVFKDITGTFTNSGEIVINAKVAFDANVLSIITESDEYRYIIFVSVQDHTKVNGDSDRVCLKVDANTFFVDESDPGMIVPETVFLEHPYTDVENDSIPELSACAEDEVVAISTFYIDKNGRESDEIIITSVVPSIIARSESADEEFTLDSFTIPTADATLDNTGMQYFSESSAREFHIAESIRKNITLDRREDLDDGDKYYYQLRFPFMVRWEYWQALSVVNSAFFNNSLPNNGKNHRWFRYANSQVTDWQTYYKITVNATKNGTPLKYELLNAFTINDYTEISGDYIKTFDETFTTELYNAVTDKKYILQDANTGVQVVFEMDSGYDISKCTVEIHIEANELGGTPGTRRLSTVNAQITDTWFKGINDDGLTIKAAPSTTILRARALIDKTLIPFTNPVYKISARLYYEGLPTEFMLFEDGTPMEFEDSGFMEYE